MTVGRNRNSRPYRGKYPDQSTVSQTRLRAAQKCQCGKVWSESKSQAKKAAKAIKSLDGDQTHVTFYECEFGGWHWTRQRWEGYEPWERTARQRAEARYDLITDDPATTEEQEN